MSALFGAKNIGFFEIFDVSARTRSGVEPVRIFCRQGEKGSIFPDFVRTYFMYDPLSNRWPLHYGVLQQCVKLVITSGVARISKWGWGLAGFGGGSSSCRRPSGIWGLRRRRQGGLGTGGPSAGRFLQFFNKNKVFLCIFRPK